MSAPVDVSAVLEKTSAGLWSVANNCTRSDLATTMRGRAEEFDLARTAVTDMLAIQGKLAPLVHRIVSARTELEERDACKALAKLYNDDLDAFLNREFGGAS